MFQRPLSSLLAIDTATDALSLALQVGDELRVSHAVIPRRHQQELVARLDALLDGRSPGELNLDAVAYGRGPGSFTGLRIATSFAQGLAFSLGRPVIGLSTLEVQLHSLLRQRELPASCLLMSTIDARIGQLYAAFYRRSGAALEPLGEARLLRPEELAIPGQCAAGNLPLIALGSGCAVIPDERLPCAERYPDVLPEARDMLPLAARALARGEVLGAAQAHPDYLQSGSQWKTLAEQGRRA